MLKENENSFVYKKFLYLIAVLVVTIAIDISLVKVYDLIHKSFISEQIKLLLFSINTSVCLLIVYIIIDYLENSFKGISSNKPFSIHTPYRISLNALFALGALTGLAIFQQFYNNYYGLSITIFIISISYATAAAFIIRLAILFISWYRSNRNWVVFLYSASMIMISFNLIMTVIVTDAKLTVRPDLIREYYGGSVDLAFGKFTLIENIYLVSSIMSFVSLWVTTALLINYYREKLVKALWYWVILAIPLFYFLLNYFYRFIFATFMLDYLAVDPSTVSIILTMFLTLSKPIGGLTFAIAFWKISKIVAYEKNIKTYMIITGWGIFLIYGTNQAVLQVLTPYPPFGIATLTVLILAAFLMLLGVYNSATLVSANTKLRNSMRKHAIDSIFLGNIGRAEMQKQVEKTVKKIAGLKYQIETDTHQNIEFDEKGLKDYVSFLAKEVKKVDVKDPKSEVK